MSGISSTLSIARTAIAAQQYGLNITGQNIANVNNPDYSVQRAEHFNRTPAEYAGFLFGTGVDMEQVRQNVDNLLERRLTSEISIQASFDEQESYMRILEGFFDITSDSSISVAMTDFWRSWQNISLNPGGPSERIAVFESGERIAANFESAVLKMDDMVNDISQDISAAVGRVNTLSAQIADLNRKIAGNEINRTANDQRDLRNRLLDEMGELIDITTYEHSDGTVTVNAAGNFTVVSKVEMYRLTMVEKEVAWENSASGEQIISDDITSGRIGGLLEMRDTIIPKYRAEVNELSREMIWAINYQHSQGIGSSYFDEPIIGDYSTDDSRWLSSFDFGIKIDYSKDFNMWVEDTSTSDTQYNKISIDMGISEARISNWQGRAPSELPYKYRLTVVDDAVLGNKEVTETDGDGLGRMWGLTLTSGAATTVAMTLDRAIADQTLRVFGGPDGTQVINVRDSGGHARRSAASVAEALNAVNGVDAFASETEGTFNTGSITNAEDGDIVSFSLYVDGIIEPVSFTRDSSVGTLLEQFEDALLSVAEKINDTNADNDLVVSGSTIKSSSGKTLGVQDFNVTDNAGISLGNFTNFNEGDVVTFTIDSMSGTSAASTTSVSVDLSDIDTTDQAELAAVFGDKIAEALSGTPFVVEKDLSTNSVKIRSTDGSDIRVRDAGNDSGDDAAITITSLSGTTADAGNVDSILDFTAAANDTARYNADTTSGDDLIFSGQDTQVTINESTAGAVNKTAVITGTLTVVMEPGMNIQTNVSGAGSGGLFDSGLAKVGSSIITLGGDGGFTGFTSSTAAGETISFDLDGTTISFSTTSAGGTSDLALATLIEAELAAGLSTDYQVIRTGTSVSVIKDSSLDDPITIDNFTDSFGSNAEIQVRTGTGKGSNQPENDRIEADPARSFRNSTTSTLYNDTGTILWERLNTDGISTGASGLLTVEDEGQVVITESGIETVSFDISKGSLVAGNTMVINTDTTGNPDPLDFHITGRANSINDIYRFRVVSGGKVGHLPSGDDPPLVIEWTNSVETGTFTIEGHDPPFTPKSPIVVDVDGMTLNFADGTLVADDVFTITTGDTGLPQFETTDGRPTGEKLSDWHWTIDSFADQFNKDAFGMKAVATLDNRLKFEASETYHAMKNEQFSGENGFDETNVSIVVTDWSAIDFKASDLRFERSSDGFWSYSNDPTGGNLQLIPQGGDDDGFGVDFTGDGLADIRIEFNERVTGAGHLEFDFEKHDSEDIGFAFSDNDSSASGLVAAAGINTFFKGVDAMTMEVNDKLSDTRLIAASAIDSETGHLSEGDGTNARAIAAAQHVTQQMKIWTYQRGKEPESSIANASIDEYFTQMMGSLGIESRSIKNAKDFADIMVNSITEQRNAVSAVSLDEEMIKLMKFQHAFSAASKLLTVSDEMLNTLISMR